MHISKANNQESLLYVEYRFFFVEYIMKIFVLLLYVLLNISEVIYSNISKHVTTNRFQQQNVLTVQKTKTKKQIVITDFSKVLNYRK